MCDLTFFAVPTAKLTFLFFLRSSLLNQRKKFLVVISQQESRIENHGNSTANLRSREKFSNFDTEILALDILVIAFYRAHPHQQEKERDRSVFFFTF